MKKIITINAPVSRVWQALTIPELMKKWMMPDIDINIVTDWKIGNPIQVSGKMNGKNFENKGTVLQFDPEKNLHYTHLSSISRLPDRLESYSILAFQLKPLATQTILEFTLSNFPSESIHKHLTFYWNVALEVFKRNLETPG